MCTYERARTHTLTHTNTQTHARTQMFNHPEELAASLAKVEQIQQQQPPPYYPQPQQLQPPQLPQSPPPQQLQPAEAAASDTVAPRHPAPSSAANAEMQKPQNPLAAAGGAGGSCCGGGGRGSSLGADMRGEGGSHGRGGGGGKAAAETLGDQGQRKRQRGEEDPQQEGTLKNVQECPLQTQVKMFFDDQNWYLGTVTKFDARSKKYTIEFDDGEVQETMIPDNDVKLVPQRKGSSSSSKGAGKRAQSETSAENAPAPVAKTPSGSEDNLKPWQEHADVEKIKKQFIQDVKANEHKCHIQGCIKDFSQCLLQQRNAVITKH